MITILSSLLLSYYYYYYYYYHYHYYFILLLLLLLLSVLCIIIYMITGCIVQPDPAQVSSERCERVGLGGGRGGGTGQHADTCILFQHNVGRAKVDETSIWDGESLEFHFMVVRAAGRFRHFGVPRRSAPSRTRAER